MSEDVHLIDAPGTPAIVLTWKMARDGAKPVGNLQFEVQNTTGQAVEVELHASTRASGDAVERSVGRLSVSAHSRIDQAFAVDQLGLQTIGSATSTLIVATYKGPDGLTA